MKVYCSVHNSLKLVSALCQISLDQAFPGSDVNIHVKFMHQLAPRSASGHFPSDSAIKNLHVFPFSLMYATCPADIMVLDLFDEEVKLCSFFIVTFFWCFSLRVLLQSFWVLRITHTHTHTHAREGVLKSSETGPID
jgi:hypothetical protein